MPSVQPFDLMNVFVAVCACMVFNGVLLSTIASDVRRKKTIAIDLRDCQKNNSKCFARLVRVLFFAEKE